MSQVGRGCSQRVWKENGILSFINLYFAFLGTYLSYKQCIEHNNKITIETRPREIVFVL